MDLPRSSPSSPPPRGVGGGGSSSWAVTAAGTLGLDDLTTAAGSRLEVPGGSALYFGLAAVRLARVRAVGAVGQDGQELLRILDTYGVDRTGVAQLPGATYRWRAEHHRIDPVPVREDQRLGVYLDWQPELPAAARDSQIIFLGSMHPDRQLEVLAQCHSPRLIALDTMRDFIATKRALLLELVAAADLLFVNQAELADLTKSEGPEVDAARSLIGRGRLRAVVIKQGKKGATLITRARELTFPAPEVDRVVDPTGAGDALAGGLLGRMAQLSRTDEESMEDAMSWGLECAALAISAFGTAGLAASRNGPTHRAGGVRS